jgi:glycosyltransferase involved in cell wall biosynthesis
MDKQKKILVICPHPQNMVPGQRLKYEQYFTHWQSNGFTITVSPFFSVRMQHILYTKGNTIEKMYWVCKGYAKRIKEYFTLQQYDVVYIFLWVTPFGAPIMERLFVHKNKKVIYDIDDAIFLKADSLFNQYANIIKGRNKPFFLMKHAQHVIACTPYLTDVAKKYNNQVTDISSTINTASYQPVNTYQNNKQLVLGWSGSHSTSKFLFLIQDVLLQLHAIHPFTLIVMGDANFKIEGLQVKAIDWTDEAEIPTLQQFDIGLYPLPLHDDWVLGKSGLKALQYMAVGIPVVATAVGANYRIMHDGLTGCLVQTKQQWLQCLTQLINNHTLRKNIGQAARQHVVQHYSIQATAPVYLNILQQVAQ